MSKLARSSSPYDNDYESYENTRDTARLRTEYDPQPHAPGPKPSEKSTVNPRTDRIISRIRLSLRILSFLLSLSIVAVLGHAVGLYLKTKNDFITDQQVTMRVWLGNLKTRPTYVLLGVASAATLISLILIIASFNKTIRHVTNIGNLATAITSMVCVILWFAAGIYYKADDMNDRMHLDLVSYTCGHIGHPLLRSDIGSLKVVCGELRYAWWAVCLMGTVELASSATVGWGITAAKKKGTYSKI